MHYKHEDVMQWIPITGFTPDGIIKEGTFPKGGGQLEYTSQGGLKMGPATTSSALKA